MTTNTADVREWHEPDGAPVEVGEHAHHALWDHEGEKWDAVPDGHTLVDDGQLERLRAVEALVPRLLDAIHASDEANIHGWSHALRVALSAKPSPSEGQAS